MNLLTLAPGQSAAGGYDASAYWRILSTDIDTIDRAWTLADRRSAIREVMENFGVSDVTGTTLAALTSGDADLIAASPDIRHLLSNASIAALLRGTNANLAVAASDANSHTHDGGWTVEDIGISKDESKLYMLEGGRLREFTMSVAGDLSAGTNTGNTTINNAGTEVGFEWSPDGRYLMMFNNNSTGDGDTVYLYRANTAGTATGGVTLLGSYIIGTTDLLSGTVSSDGRHFLTLHSTARQVRRYDMPSPWTLNTSVKQNGTGSVNGESSTMMGIRLSLDGMRLFGVAGGAQDAVYQYNFGTRLLMSSMTYSTTSFSISALEGSPRGICMNFRNSKLFVSGSENAAVHRISVA